MTNINECDYPECQLSELKLVSEKLDEVKKLFEVRDCKKMTYDSEEKDAISSDVLIKIISKLCSMEYVIRKVREGIYERMGEC
jgi:hypothetical protein